MKKVAMTGKKRRAFFEPAMSSSWLMRNSMTDSTKFCAPEGMSFIVRVARKAPTARMIIAAQAEIIVLEMLRKPALVMTSAGTMISGWGPRATMRPTTIHASAATAMMMSLNLLTRHRQRRRLRRRRSVS